MFRAQAVDGGHIAGADEEAEEDADGTHKSGAARRRKGRQSHAAAFTI